MFREYENSEEAVIADRAEDVEEKKRKHPCTPDSTHGDPTMSFDNSTDPGDSRRTSISKEHKQIGPEENKRWHIGSDKFFHRPPGEGTSWKSCAKLIDNHDIAMCQFWREEVDTLAVFAGLFSAVLTAFIIESYKWMMIQSDDVSADYLRQLVALTSGVDVSSVSTIDKSSPLPTHVMVRINSFWFSSLTLSLSSALIGIVSKQWLREYLRDTGHSHQTNLSVRQVKYEGLMKWYVGPVISTIPLLLQTALFLFLIGIIDLLWHLQTTVATIITTLGSSTMLFFLVTTVLPGVQYLRHRRGLRLHVIYQFPFKSPQAWLFLQASVAIVNFFAWAYAYVTSLKKRPNDKRKDVHVAPYQTHASWTQFDLDWTSQQDKVAGWHHEPSALARCLGFMDLTFEHGSLRDWIWNCLWEMRYQAANARHVLKCFRRDFNGEFDVTSLEERLIQGVKYYLDPRGYSRYTSEPVMFVLLDTGRGAPRAEARLEHIIRIFNSFDISGTERIPSMVYKVMRNALDEIVDTSSPELSLQLFYVAQSLLARSHLVIDEPFNLASSIVDYLSRIEAEGDPSIPNLSLNICKEITEWLESQPIPTTREGWSDYKSLVFWAAHIAVMLAQRFHPSGSSDVLASSHPRILDVHALVQMVFAKLLLIPADVSPTWTPADFDMEDLTSVKVSLETLAAPQVKPAASVRRRSVKARGKQDSSRTDSDGAFTQTSESTAVSSDSHRRSYENFNYRRCPSPPSMPDMSTHVVHWNMPVDSESDDGGAEEPPNNPFAGEVAEDSSRIVELEEPVEVEEPVELEEPAELEEPGSPQSAPNAEEPPDKAFAGALAADDSHAFRPEEAEAQRAADAEEPPDERLADVADSRPVEPAVNGLPRVADAAPEYSDRWPPSDCVTGDASEVKRNGAHAPDTGGRESIQRPPAAGGPSGPAAVVPANERTPSSYV
ncbi:hypothetical protein BD626DRAFT_572805 [Schizophyllum amplum]|uniref:DUF6535 domain-containing protein n=1 Tax=Schizophyllum amplum TaxID=97359 RepID=A0A550C337_9AGAR|nr:hypothetical protein BD626DRAFT_572805 [Auriculariopsis ampla]